ncbi:DUF4064 domain-containing protein [Staphylococcus simulans]
MNRKAERIIGWIGVGLTILYMLLFLIGIFMNDGMLADILLKDGDTSMSPEFLHQTMIFTTIGLVVVAIVAAVGIVLSKTSRITAGIILIVAAIVGLYFSNFISSILFFIVAIMLFVRRSPAKREANKAYDREHGYFDDITRNNENANKHEKVNPEGKPFSDHSEHERFDTEEHVDESELAQQRTRDDHERPRKHDLD